jgi:hypothetical protein
MPRKTKKEMEDLNGLSNLIQPNPRVNLDELLDLQDTGCGGYGGMPLVQDKKPLTISDSISLKPKLRPNQPKLASDSLFKTLEDRTQLNENAAICSKILEVNTLLQQGKFAPAEFALGRKLTSTEIVNKSLSESSFPSTHRTAVVHVQEPRQAPILTEYEHEQLPEIESEEEEDDETPVERKRRIAQLRREAYDELFSTAPEADVIQQIHDEQDPARQAFLEKQFKAYKKRQASSSSAPPAKPKVTVKPTKPIGKAKIPVKIKQPAVLKQQGKGFSKYLPPRMTNLVPFGRLALDLDQLENGDVISIIYPGSRRKVNGLKNRVATPGMKLAISQIMAGVKPSTKGLNQEEIKYLELLTHMARIPADKRGAVPVTKRKAVVPVKKLHDEFRVIIGEIEAGNDSKALRQQLSELLAVMVHRELITQEQAQRAIEEYVE